MTECLDTVRALREQMRQWNLPDPLRHYDLYGLKSTIVACALNLTCLDCGFRSAYEVSCVTKELENPTIAFYEQLAHALHFTSSGSRWEDTEGGYQECYIVIAKSPDDLSTYTRGHTEWRRDKTQSRRTLGALYGYPSCCIRMYVEGKTSYAQFLRDIHGCPDCEAIGFTSHLNGLIPCSLDCPQALELGQRQAQLLQETWPDLLPIEQRVARMVNEADYELACRGAHFPRVNERVTHAWDELLHKYRSVFANL